MKSVTRITLVDDTGHKFFGEGPARLLHAVEKSGSLRAAAASMDMAYTKALKILKNAENTLGFPLTIRVTGGRGGGGSRLTPEGSAWLSRYESYRDACTLANLKLYREFFPEMDPAPTFGRLGCVIMASGLGRRFGGNKLMADFKGKPLIQWILEATEGIFARRIVVTRHKELEEICRRQGIDVIFHDLPYQNDTIRLGLQALARNVEDCMTTVGAEGGTAIQTLARNVEGCMTTVGTVIQALARNVEGCMTTAGTEAVTAIQALSWDVEGCMFCLGDQPLLRWDTIASLALSAAKEREAIWRTAYGDTVGSPVLFPQWAFPELLTLPEGQGGRYVLQKYPEQIRTIPVRDKYELMDIDCPEDLKFLSER